MLIENIYSYREHIPSSLAGEGSVWCFQASHLMPLAVALEVEEAVVRFCQDWTSHGEPVINFAKIFFGQCLVFYAENAGGCSIDKLFHFVKEQSEQHQLAMLNRTLQAFYVKGKIEILPLTQVKHAFDLGKIDKQTPYIDNSISTMKELREQWILPVGNSWLMDVISS